MSLTPGRGLRLEFDELARAGRPKGGGYRPFGFEADKLTVNETEASLLWEAAQRVLAGDGLYAITRDWEARGLVTPAGNVWNMAIPAVWPSAAARPTWPP